MQKKTFKFSRSAVDYYFRGSFAQLSSVVPKKNSILITDENIFAAHPKKFSNWKTILLKPGEEYKIQATIDLLINQLIELGADRKTTVVGVGGGVITDITGYLASVYMRGIPFGFVPTTLLGMVDASIGGKNGIDVGIYKNMAGTISQPAFILHDASMLQTLPDNEWKNGFAEIIKHASIMDAALFRQLEQRDLFFFRKKKKELEALIERNALLKTRIVQKDEFEKGNRKLLNFGHTLAHAIENQYDMPHGEAVAVGMAYASVLSSHVLGFKHANRVTTLIGQYGLPAIARFNRDRVMDVLMKDKKREGDGVNFILLENIGKAVIRKLTRQQLYEHL